MNNQQLKIGLRQLAAEPLRIQGGMGDFDEFLLGDELESPTDEITKCFQSSFHARLVNASLHAAHKPASGQEPTRPEAGCNADSLDVVGKQLIQPETTSKKKPRLR